MEQTWRWYGPDDPITLVDIRQAGATGIVSALHDRAPGEVWPQDDIRTRKDMIDAAGLRWSVVESLPVSEDIKSGGPTRDQHLQNYCISLENLAAEGIKTICYNFMPVLDWTRTTLRREMPDGALAMHFDLTSFATFDIHILARPGADKDFPAPVVKAAKKLHDGLAPAERDALTQNVIAGLPGAAMFFTLDTLREELARYAGISPDQLRENLATFLRAIVPTAERLGIRLCCHPDDPPFALLGLPRIVSTHDDLRAIINAVPSPANGITFCSGSLGASGTNDLPTILSDIAPHVHFLHLRSVKREDIHGAQCSFYEDAHLAGDGNITELVRIVVAEEARRRTEDRADSEIPMRPDHGQELTTDIGRDLRPGYPLIGRLRGLAEIRGLEAAYKHLT
ncbi:mannonate dehydratase [Aliiroseovarius sp. 2305UL8-7]|uniref:mannonate dehydratase n=1 Tax=Aliiroseovarius conchicola TaxID=3121637 RepID=UPI0035293059